MRENMWMKSTQSKYNPDEEVHHAAKEDMEENEQEEDRNGQKDKQKVEEKRTCTEERTSEHSDYKTERERQEKERGETRMLINKLK